MGKIYVILGKSSTGKSTLEKSLCDLFERKGMPFKKTVSTTTRPKRDYEAHGVDYFFVTEDQFKAKCNEGDFCEYTLFNNWCYGTSITANEIDLSKNSYIMVLNPSGLRQLHKYFGRENVFSIYLTCNDKDRLVRSLLREEDPDCKEICRRFQADEADFFGIEWFVDVAINTTNTSLDESLRQVYHTLLKMAS